MGLPSLCVYDELRKGDNDIVVVRPAASGGGKFLICFESDSVCLSPTPLFV